MDYKAEAIILKEFSKFFLDGSLYRGSKPVMWSPVEKTALAEAEIEYQNVLSKSIYVSFKIKESQEKQLIDSSVVIWTTTPWTIPGNQAVAYGEKIVYILIDIESSNLDKLVNKKLIISKSLLKEVTSFCNIKKFKIIKEFKGSLLQGTIALHPLNKKGYDHQIPLLKARFCRRK